MTVDTNKSTLSSHWSSFRLIWWIITILFLLALLISWLLGYGPNGKFCQVSTIVEKRITTPDTSAPLISLNDSSVLNLLIGDKYKEAGARAIDDINGKLNIKISGKVDTSIAGEYTVTYTVSDTAGNTTEKTRKVIVSATPDNEPPVIKLNDDVITLQTGEHYIDEGATAIVNVDGDIDVIS